MCRGFFGDCSQKSFAQSCLTLLHFFQLPVLYLFHRGISLSYVEVRLQKVHTQGRYKVYPMIPADSASIRRKHALSQEGFGN